MQRMGMAMAFAGLALLARSAGAQAGSLSADLSGTAAGASFGLDSYRPVPYTEPYLQVQWGAQGTLQDQGSRGYYYSAPQNFYTQLQEQDGSTNLGLDYRYQASTDAVDATVDLPLTLDWGAGNATETFRNIQNSTTTYNQWAGKASHADWSLAPSLQWAGYAGPWQAGAALDASWAGQYANAQGTEQSWIWSGGAWANSPTAQRDFNTVLYQGQGSAELTLGLGRLRETRWAWNALELQRQLREHGALKRELSPAELQSLAERLARQGSAYAWDFQEQRISQTKELGAWLAESGAVERVSSVAAVVLMSEAYLLPVQPRLKGAELLLVADDQASLTLDHVHAIEPPDFGQMSSESDFGPQSADGPGLGLRWAWSQPLSQAWQCDLTQGWRYAPYQGIAANSLTATGFVGEQVLSCTTQVLLSYIPNARWSASAGASLAYSNGQWQEWDGTGQWQTAYGQSAWAGGLGLNYQCQLASTLTVTLAAAWQWDAAYRSGERYPSASPVLGPYLSWQDQPWAFHSIPSLSLTLSRRVF
jgi:hypothetical protein